MNKTITPAQYAAEYWKILENNPQIIGHLRNWRVRIMNQPFFGQVKGGDKIKIRMPHRYE